MTSSDFSTCKEGDEWEEAGAPWALPTHTLLSRIQGALYEAGGSCSVWCVQTPAEHITDLHKAHTQAGTRPALVTQSMHPWSKSKC